MDASGECAKLRQRAQRMIKSQGLREAAESLGLKPDALARFVAGANSHAGTIRLVQDGLRRNGRNSVVNGGRNDR